MRHDDEAARIDAFRPAQPQTGPDRRDPAVLKADIASFVAPVRRIDDPAALKDEIQHRPPYRGEPTQAFAVAEVAGARGGGRAFPQRRRTEAASPKAALTPSPRCRVNGSPDSLPRGKMHQHVVVDCAQTTAFAQFAIAGGRRAVPFCDRRLANRIDRLAQFLYTVWPRLTK